MIQGIPRLEDLLQEVQARREMLDRMGVYFVRDIDDQEAERFSKSLLVMAGARRGNTDIPIVIYINSGGGSVGAGFAMMEMMYKVKRDYGVLVNTVITGYAYSMGAIIFQAGDRRSMGYFSTMMLHSSTWTISGEDQRVFRDYEKLSNQYQQVIAELFARRTGKHTPAWWKRFIYSGRDRFLSPQECLNLGLVDEVCTFDQCYVSLSEMEKKAASGQPPQPS